jgi:3',5'-cyclic-AMP phosphodiesterase
MGIFKAVRNGAVYVLLAAIVWSCDPWFAYSPYEAALDDALLGTTEKNLTLIQALDAGDSKPFKVAVLADAHYHYGKLGDAVTHINADPSYAFAIVAGDLTENGLKQEFDFFYETMARLKIPYITVIGNHDYLSNGDVLYKQMYGPYNYTLVFNNTKFILFDNNTIESEKEPDLDWFANELVNDNGYDHVIPLAHIPPYDVQMTEYRDKYHELLVQNGIPISIHGHRHDFSIEDVFGDGIKYVTISSPQKRSYTELTITAGAVEVTKVEY